MNPGAADDPAQLRRLLKRFAGIEASRGIQHKGPQNPGAQVDPDVVQHQRGDYFIDSPGGKEYRRDCRNQRGDQAACQNAHHRMEAGGQQQTIGHYRGRQAADVKVAGGAHIDMARGIHDTDAAARKADRDGHFNDIADSAGRLKGSQEKILYSLPGRTADQTDQKDRRRKGQQHRRGGLRRIHHFFNLLNTHGTRSLSPRVSGAGFPACIRPAPFPSPCWNPAGRRQSRRRASRSASR